MLQRLLTACVTSAALAAAVPSAMADDGTVTNGLLAVLYSPAGADQADSRRFYAEQGYRPVWWQDGAWTDQALEAIAALEVADRHGLSPVRYGAPLFDEAVRDGLAAELGPEVVVATELALTQAMLTYLGERMNGVLDPETVGWHTRRPEPVAPSDLLAAALRSRDVGTWVEALAPRRPGYDALVEELALQRAQIDTPWPPIAAGDSIKPGTSDPRLPELRERLMQLGELAVLPPDGPQDTGQFFYDTATVTAVERFQRRMGLEVDGVVGRRTLAQLNVTPAERAQSIVANMEKLRWMPASSSLEDRHVEVNLPGYRLVAYEHGLPVLEMPVIVGEPDHPTPVFSDRIVNLKFAPDWTVPFKIAKNELLPKIQESTSWLVANNYEVISDWGRGSVISPWSVDWSTVTPETWSYLLRQLPGPSSALGLVRFSLTNPLDIYLHDTGSRNLFARAGRSLSHGCVRVGDPVALAAYALATEPEPWSHERIEEAMNAPRTFIHRLAQPVPVDFFYVTAWREADGMSFRRDIYGLDSQVLAGLNAAGSAAVVTLPLLIGADEADDEDVAVLEPPAADAPL